MTFNLDEWYYDGEQPFYTDTLENVQKTWPKAGLEQAIADYLEDNTDDKEASSPYQLYFARNEKYLISLFNKRFALREIGGETEERWQKLVYMRFIDIINKYILVFKFQTEIDNNNVDMLRETTERTGDTSGNNTNTGSSTNKNKNTFNDTPITPLIDTENYATNITDIEGENSSENTGTSKTHYNTFEYKTKDGYAEAFSKFLGRYKDPFITFVQEFEICFIDELGRI